MVEVKPQPGIMEIKPYVGGAATIEGMSNVIKLSSNENPFGPSEDAIEAFKRAGHELHRYPNTDHASLRQAIGDLHNLDPGRIICGVGSDEVITFLCQVYAGPGDEVIYTEHGFSMYKISARAVGATPIKVPERERVVDVNKILDGVTDKTRLVFVTNPGNPTGTMVSQAELERLAQELPTHVLLILDGAYTEYVDGFDGGASLVKRYDNVFMTRTFSKMYGLENTRLRSWLAEALAELGVPSDTSCTNFILARFANENEAKACDEFLQQQGVIVRGVAGYGLPNCLRITIGDETSCRRVASLVEQFKGLGSDTQTAKDGAAK